MPHARLTRPALIVCLLAAWVLLPAHRALAQDTEPRITDVVLFETSLGDFEVGLFREATPQTVANFLSYVTGTTLNGGSFNDPLNFIHRSARFGDGSPFVIQGGGFVVGDSGLGAMPTDPPVINEPGISNTRGTIAMAKQAGDPNSATSQWFFNLQDNGAVLDDQNGGFTAFGRVLGEGMQIVDAIAALPVFDASAGLGSAFGELPLRDFTPEDAQSGQPFTVDNLVAIEAITIVPQFPFADTNHDGSVDLADLTVLGNEFGQSGGGLLADANGDGTVDLADLTVLGNEFGTNTTSGSSPAAVPEPATLTLLAVTGFALLPRPRRA